MRGRFFNRIIVLVTISTLLVIALGVYASRSLATLNEGTDWVVHSERVRYELSHVLQLLVDAGTGVRRFEATHEDRSFQVADTALADLPLELAALHRILADDPELARLEGQLVDAAHQRERVARNVASLVEPPKQVRAETPMPLDVEECRKLLATAAGRRNAARWTVALALGLRQSEALGLQWRDIDLDAGRLSVRRGLHRVDGEGVVFQEPKTPRSRRTIAIPGPLIEALRAQRETQDLERMVAGSEWQDWDVVFAQPNGRPLDKHSDYEAWIRLLDDAGVRRIRLHDGRHTAATLLLSAGVHPRVVMELLGHSQMRTTTDIYSHVMPALAQEAADRMGRTLWG